MNIGAGRPLRRRGLRVARALTAAVAASLLALGEAGCQDKKDPPPVGDPDPGHHLLWALRPVLSAVPVGAHVTQRQVVAPMWDSCDGEASTFGWDPPTVVAQFDGGGSRAQVEAHIRAAMRTLGWTEDAGSSSDMWLWHKAMPGGGQAQAQLLDGTSSGWMLQASTPAATHRVRGC